MTSVVCITLATLATLATWWLTRRSAQRAVAHRARELDARLEQQRLQSVERSSADRRANEALRQAAEGARQALQLDTAAHATRVLELGRQAELRVSDERARAAEERGVLDARINDGDRQRLELERRLVELGRVTAQRLTESANAAQRKIIELEALRRRGSLEAIAREDALAADLERWQGRARALAEICQLDAVVSAPLYADRPAPHELDAIARRVRGLTFVDCVTIADASGLPIERGGGRDADDLAALVPIVAQAAAQVDGALGPVRSVVVDTDDARVIELRRLPAWTRGAWLVAQASAQPPPAAALDAAVAYAHAVRDTEHDSAWRSKLAARGRLGPGGPRRDALGDELEQATRGLGARTVALVLGDQVLAGVEAEGVGAIVFAHLLRSLHHIHAVAGARLRTLAIPRIAIDVAGTVRLSLAPLGSGSRLELVTLTVGRPLDPLEVERVVGRLRRFLDTSGAAAATGVAHD